MYWVGYHQAAHTYPIPNWIGFIERLKEQVILRICMEKNMVSQVSQVSEILVQTNPLSEVPVAHMIFTIGL